MNEPSTTHNDHPGWRLSRSCIRDTYFAKRTGVFRQKNNLLTALCATNLRSLRETQLAPNKEKDMISNRYKVWQAVRKFRSKACGCCLAKSDFSEYVRRADDPLIQVLCDGHMALCDACLGMVLQEANSESDDTAIIYIEGGLVQWLALPEGYVRSYASIDEDVFCGGDEEECRCFVTHYLMAHKPGMRFV